MYLLLVSSLFCFVCYPVIFLGLFSVFCSLFSANQSISTVVCSSQLYIEDGGATQPRSKHVNVSEDARIIAYGAWHREMHHIWESSSLLFTIICSVFHLSHQHILSQLETAVLDSTHIIYYILCISDNKRIIYFRLPTTPSYQAISISI